MNECDSWPAVWRRARVRKDAPFRKTSRERLLWCDGIERIYVEFDQMGVPEENVSIWINSLMAYEEELFDPGVAVYWKKDDQQPTRCIAIDRYTRIPDNLAAIAVVLAAMRTIERYGGANILDRAFLGFAEFIEKATL